MSKYTFDRLGADRFESLVQALLERRFRTTGALTQFGDGPDGAREATWSQLSSHSDYIRPTNEESDVPKEWVFQVKYHDIGLRGWSGARDTVASEVGSELDKIVNKYSVPCHKFVLVTNVPFTGVRHVGTRDKVNVKINEWKDRIPEIEVWDASDLSAMLDADPETRTTYLDDILPGDVLRAILHDARFRDDRRQSAVHAYLKSILRSEREAKTEEAGDDEGLKLERIFVDLNLKWIPQSHLDPESRDDFFSEHASGVVPASYALLRATHPAALIRGGPGTGKSTLTQFLTLYHASRLVEPELALQLSERVKLCGLAAASDLDTQSTLRLPFRIELRRYAQWISDQPEGENPFIARYLIERINKAAASELSMDDLFAIASSNPVLLILDGLDEVPSAKARETIFNQLRVFLDRCDGENSDVVTLLSSRPQGYRGEFKGFEPVEWETVELERNDFDSYVEMWLEDRIPDSDERDDVQKRIDDGMQSQAVQELAKTLLQATVMLTIARRGHRIPHARLELFAKYVDVIFDRERNKVLSFHHL